MRRFRLSLLFVFGLFSVNSYAGEIISDVPTDLDATEKYIFYLHGSVEESEGETEKYQMAIDEIASGSLIVISEVRGDTDPNHYADKLKTQVDKLLAGGVAEKNITISGFSKGAIIALSAAGRIGKRAINYVLLAGCSEDLNEKYNVDISGVAGRILSIYDAEDEKFESCEGIIKPSGNIMFKEVELDSGKGHKVFRIPKEKFIEQWRDPLLDWTDI